MLLLLAVAQPSPNRKLRFQRKPEHRRNRQSPSASRSRSLRRRATIYPLGCLRSTLTRRPLGGVLRLPHSATALVITAAATKVYPYPFSRTRTGPALFR